MFINTCKFTLGHDVGERGVDLTGDVRHTNLNMRDMEGKKTN